MDCACEFIDGSTRSFIYSSAYLVNAPCAQVHQLLDHGIGVTNILLEEETPEGEETGVVERLVMEQLAPALEQVSGRPCFFGGDAQIFRRLGYFVHFVVFFMACK